MVDLKAFSRCQLLAPAIVAMLLVAFAGGNKASAGEWVRGSVLGDAACLAKFNSSPAAIAEQYYDCDNRTGVVTNYFEVNGGINLTKSECRLRGRCAWIMASEFTPGYWHANWSEIVVDYDDADDVRNCVTVLTNGPC